MKKDFVIDLTKGDFRDLAQGIEDYKNWVERKTDELCRRAANLCVQRIQENYSLVAYDGPHDLTVEPAEKEGNACYVVKAGGQALLFVEFGAGVHYGPNNHPEGNGFVHGTYGKGQGKNDYWFYTGQPGNAGGTLAFDERTGYMHPNTTITHGNPVNKPVYEAMKSVKEEMEQLALEVFSSE